MLKSIVFNIKQLFIFNRKFGFVAGLKLYYSFKLHKHKIKIPGIRNAFMLRHGTSDIPAFGQVFLHDEYNIRYATEPKIVIDGGANIGLFTLKIKNQFPDVTVICVEPDTENFQLLKKNIAPYKNIHCENCGLWSKDTKLKIHDKYNMGKWAMVVEEDELKGSINAMSIPTLLKKYSIDSIDVLKLDIETSEKQLFSANYEEWLPKTKMIIIELHDWMEEGCSKPFFEAVNKSFKKYKYGISGENTIIINQGLNS